jgi:hypothetical protein
VAVHCYEPETPGAPPLGVPPGMKPVKGLIPQRYAEFGSSGLTFEVKPDANPKATFALTD